MSRVTCRGAVQVCVRCLAPDPAPGHHCDHCGLPVCRPGQCGPALAASQHSLECGLVARAGGRGWGPDQLAGLMEALATVRMVLVRRQLLSPALLGLSTATGDIPAPDERVVAAARAVLGAEWDAAEFQLCYDQLFINGKSLCEVPGTRGTGLFLVFSIMNHSCVANTATILNSRERLQVKAVRRIRAGEEITVRYGGLNLGQPRRAQLLSDHWRFSCRCSRCSDPTEFGTFNSALLCPALDCSHYLCQHRALLWRCQGCGTDQPLEFVVKVIREAETFIKNNVGCDVDTDVLERTVWSLERSLHPRHFLLAQLKLVLLSKYSFLTVISHPVLERQVQLGQELLLLSLALDTVYSLVVGTVLKILIPAWNRLTEKHWAEGNLSRHQYQHRKMTTYRYVDMLIKCNKMRRISNKV